MAAIKTQGLTKFYGKNRGIENVSITVDEGEIYGFIGPNGAGKSTMIKTLLNIIFPSAGEASIFGMDCVTKAHAIKREVGYVPCEVRFYEDLKVKDMLEYSDSFYSNTDKKYTKSLSERFELEPEKRVGELSSGNKKKTAVVAALSHRPKLMVLDEPTSGLDPLMRTVLFEALREAKETGSTIFLSSHNLDEVQTLCGRVAIIREGEIADVQSISEMAARTGKKVTVRGKALPEISGEGVKVLSRTGKILMFTYQGGDPEKLLSMLSKMDLKDFLVEDVKLSDVFMSYYSGTPEKQSSSGLQEGRAK